MIKQIKLTNTIDEPIGSLSIIHDVIIPMLNDTAPNIEANIKTFLNDLNNCLDDIVGNIIKAVINKAPITFIPITTVKLVSIDSNKLIRFVLIPCDFANVSSNVTENILLYKTIYTPTTIKQIIILKTQSVTLHPSKDPYK